MKLKSLRKTCDACPAQWEGVTEDGRRVYIRYRWGYLSVGISDTMESAIRESEVVYTCQDGMHGVMSTEEMMIITGFWF